MGRNNKTGNVSSKCTTVGSLSAFPPGPKFKKRGGAILHPPKIGGQEPPVKLVVLVMRISAMM